MVKIDNLVKEYGDYRLDVSMTIPEGMIVGLIGKNGAGKSTTIKSILGLIKPQAGQVTVLGKEVSKLSASEKGQIGVALSDSGFSMYLCPNDVLPILRKMYKDFDENYFVAKCGEFGLPMNKQIKEFSTGMKAKFRVLVAICHKAKLLILDEPTSGLDVEARNEILDILRDYMSEDESRTILISSHIASDLEGLCDELYLIHNVKVLLHDETVTILDEYGVIKVSEEEYEKLEKQYLLQCKKEAFGYACLTNQKCYYRENYPQMVVENAGIDDLILLMSGGK